MPAMSNREQIRAVIEQLIAKTFHRVDSGRATSGVELVTKDFTLVVPNTTVDHAQYVAIMAKREAAFYTTRHSFSNTRVLEESDTKVSIAFVVTAHRLNHDETDTSITIADFADDWTLEGDVWRLHSRSITPVFPLGLGG
jgi:SnoaL-like domain